VSRTTFERIVFATIIAAMFVVAIGLNNKALATWTESDYIDGVAIAALEGGSTDLTVLEATSVDPQTSPVCRNYADVALTAITVARASDLYPDGVLLHDLSVYLNEQLPIARNDCQLGI
jgi:hypothetical protein